MKTIAQYIADITTATNNVKAACTRFGLGAGVTKLLPLSFYLSSIPDGKVFAAESYTTNAVTFPISVSEEKHWVMACLTTSSGTDITLIEHFPENGTGTAYIYSFQNHIAIVPSITYTPKFKMQITNSRFKPSQNWILAILD